MHRTLRSADALFVALTLALVAWTCAACEDAAPAVERCVASVDCPSTLQCVEGQCRAPVSVDDTLDDTLGDGGDTEPPSDLTDLTDASDDGADAAQDTRDDADVPTGPCAACAPEALCCDERCVDPDSAVRDCGGCGQSCLGAPQVAAVSCVAGSCRIDACALGWLDCDALAGNGCETPQGDAHCGACLVACAEGSSCVDGVCACDGASCPCPGGGTLGDAQNCTACGQACPAGLSCVDGGCACPDGGAIGDDQNCAACDDACGANEVCAAGNCVCQSGVAGDDQNCGACGQACPVGTSCTAQPDGTFACGCGPGLADCGSGCIDVESDTQNCGGCNVICPAGAICQLGQCVLDCPATRADCDGDPATGCERRLDDDGSCGTECGTARDCGEFYDRCVSDPAGYTCQCDNGSTCRPGERCEGFIDRCECASGVSCAANEVCCGDGGQRVCADLDKDIEHCGGCNRACPPGQTCTAGACQ